MTIVTEPMRTMELLTASREQSRVNCRKISYTYEGPNFLGLTGHLPWVLIGAPLDEFRLLSQKIGQNLGIISSTLSLMGGMYVSLRSMIGLTVVRHGAESLRSKT